MVASTAGAADRATAERVASVTDGDTFRLVSGERIRIANVDAPETQKNQAKCASEVRLGRAATRDATALLVGRTVDLIRTGRSYRRTVAAVRLDGRDLGSELVRRGIARPWPRGTAKPDWCR